MCMGAGIMGESSDKPAVEVSTGNWFLAIVFWIVMFYGDPDIADAIIHWLMSPLPEPPQ